MLRSYCQIHSKRSLTYRAKQANALQWRWIYPLIRPHQPSPRLMPSIPVLRATLDFLLATPRDPTYHWSLTFPHDRPTIPRLFGSVRNIFRSVDTLPHQLSKCHATMSTCLHLTISEIIIHSLTTNQPSDSHLVPVSHYNHSATIHHMETTWIQHLQPPQLTPRISSKHKFSSTQHLQQENHLTHPIQPTSPQQLRSFRPQNALEILNLPDTITPSFYHSAYDTKLYSSP
ncbi:hypothetical protein [Parasitella parasitica]|uniref:Uncharacterized protein n=1 Tax=Parasitella parasitica TaxID=35722 RepID=A0A0B7MVG2_9FUNG|nr:hypothetical protein [Parasitella parasitica]